TVYPRVVNGNVAPLRTIAGPLTGLNSPVGIAVDTTHDEVVISDYTHATLSTFGRSANGNVAPLRVVGGGQTGLFAPVGVAYDATSDSLYVADVATDEVVVHARSASGNQTPVRRFSAASSLLGPMWLIVDPTHDEVVVSTSTPSVVSFARGASGS